MNSEDIKDVLLVLLSGLSPIIITQLLEKKRFLREIVKQNIIHKNDLEKNIQSQLVESKKIFSNDILTITYTTSVLEYNITTTSSVLTLSNIKTLPEFDVKFREEIEYLFKLKSLIMKLFPEKWNDIERISGLYDQYWMTLRLLISNNPLDNMNIMNDVTRISSEIKNELSNLNYFFKNEVQKSIS